MALAADPASVPPSLQLSVPSPVKQVRPSKGSTETILCRAQLAEGSTAATLCDPTCMGRPLPVLGDGTPSHMLLGLSLWGALGPICLNSAGTHGGVSCAPKAVGMAPPGLSSGQTVQAQGRVARGLVQGQLP